MTQPRYPWYDRKTEVMKAVSQDMGAPTAKIPRMEAEGQIMRSIGDIPAYELGMVKNRVVALERRLDDLSRQLVRHEQGHKKAHNMASWALFAMTVSVVCAIFSLAILISMVFLGG